MFSFSLFKQKKSFIVALCLALGLLWAQNFLLQHALEHQFDAHDDAPACDICAVAQYNQDSLADKILVSPALMQVFFELILTISFVFVSTYYLTPNPRAPPKISRSF